MKKRLALITLILLAGLMIMPDYSSAKGGKGKGNNGGKKSNNYSKFIDADGDGVCDLFVDADGDGVCDHCTGDGTGERRGGNQGSGSNFVDADGDGVCDLYVDADGDGVCDHCTGDGTGERRGGNKGAGMGNGGKNAGNGSRQQNFIDEDGDGVCDYYQTRPILNKPYPNPFSISTTLEFTLQEEGTVNVSIYGLSGNLIAELYDGQLAAGDHSYTFVADGIEPGRYFFVVKYNDMIFSRYISYIN